MEQAKMIGSACGQVADKLLEGPLPWTRMRHVYRLLGLVRSYGEDRVEKACLKILESDAVDIVRIAGILERGLEGHEKVPPAGRLGRLVPFRFQSVTSLQKAGRWRSPSSPLPLLRLPRHRNNDPRYRPVRPGRDWLRIRASTRGSPGVYRARALPLARQGPAA
jgi:hypothetical protein